MTGTAPHLSGAVSPLRARGSGRRVPALRTVLVTAFIGVAACIAAVVGIGAAVWLGADVDAVGPLRGTKEVSSSTDAAQSDRAERDPDT